MCLITKQTEPFITEEDMEVYKVLGDNHTLSPSQSFEYERDKVYTTQVEREGRNFSQCVFADFHSESQYSNETDLISYGQGFHFCVDVERAKKYLMYGLYSNNYKRTYRCIIPKGSEYYLDETGLGVASSIIIKEKVKEIT